MPTPLPPITPRLFLPQRGALAPPVQPGTEAPKPPVAPRFTPVDSDNRAQTIAVQQWADSISTDLDRIQTSILNQNPLASSPGTTTSATYTNVLAGTTDTTGPIYPDGSLGDEALVLNQQFGITVTLTANIANGAMSFRVLAADGSVVQTAGDNFSLANPGTNILWRASATYNFVAPTAGKYQIQAMYRSFGGTATFDLRQLFLSGVGH